MTTPDLADLRYQPITTVEDLTTLWRAMMGAGGFGRRRLWVVFLDEDGTPGPVVMPIDDIPAFPGVREVQGLQRVLEQVAAPGVVLLVSRPGPPAEQDSDRRWAEALAPLSSWPVHLATDPHDPSGPCVLRVLLVP
jgi:hypothetical protein